MIVSAIISFVLATVVAIFMIQGIDHMEKNHPDYKGEDLFDEE